MIQICVLGDLSRNLSRSSSVSSLNCANSKQEENDPMASFTSYNALHAAISSDVTPRSMGVISLEYSTEMYHFKLL